MKLCSGKDQACVFRRVTHGIRVLLLCFLLLLATTTCIVEAASSNKATFSFLSTRQNSCNHKFTFNHYNYASSLASNSGEDDLPHHSNTALSSSTRDIQSLQDWAKDNGVQFHNHIGVVSVPSDDDTDYTNDDWGVSLLTSDGDATTMEAGTIVLSVPTSLVLSSPKVAKELVEVYNLDLKDSMKILHDGGFANQSPEFFLFTKILLEHTKGNDSLWQPWLASLPQTFQTGIYMNSFEKSCLPPFAFALAEFETEKLQAFRQALSCLLEQPAATESLPSLKEVTLKKSDDDDDLIKWAYNVVFSRCWKYADQVDDTNTDEIGRSDIVPLGDMFNHADPANVVVNYMDRSQDDSTNETVVGRTEDESKDAVKFVLTQDIEMGHENPQLCLSYGLITNLYRFLILFGFVNDQMKELYCQILFTSPSKVMIELGCADRTKMLYRTEDGAIADTVWNTVLYSLLEQQIGNPEAEAARKALYQAHLDCDATTTSEIREKYLLEASLTLRNHVERTLKDLDELVDKVDGMIEASGDVTLVEKEYPHLLMIHRHNCFLQGVFQKVKDRLDGMIQTDMTRRRQIIAESK